MAERRSILRAVVLLVIACSCALAAATLYYPVTLRTIDTSSGRKLFGKHCASCHSLDKGSAVGTGPSLGAIAATARTRVPGVGAEEYLVDSVVDPARFRATVDGTMPQNIAQQFSNEDLANVIAFLMQQGGAVDYHKLLRALDQSRPMKAAAPENLELASIERGRELFHGNGSCAVCHVLDDSPGHNLGAPSLLASGLHSRDHIETAVRRPDAAIDDNYRQWQINAGGVVVTGRRLPSKAGKVKLLVAEAGGWRIREYNTAELEPFDDGQVVQALTTSTMPTADVWEPGALSAVIDYIRTFR
jgi:mono/diheme cytochrome c family protein